MKPDPPSQPPPLEYEKPSKSRYDRPVEKLWWVRLANRRPGRRPGKLRMIYWVVMLSLIAVALWYVHKQVGVWDELMKPPK
jgi:hypothetical protein